MQATTPSCHRALRMCSAVFVWSGRTGRAEYLVWLALLIFIAHNFWFSISGSLAGLRDYDRLHEDVEAVFYFVDGVFAVPFVLWLLCMTLSISVRRLHDIGRDARYLVPVWLPMVWAVFMWNPQQSDDTLLYLALVPCFVLGFANPDPKANAYGPYKRSP